MASTIESALGSAFETAQRLKNDTKENWSEHDKLFSQANLYKIPSELIEEIFHNLT